MDEKFVPILSKLACDYTERNKFRYIFRLNGNIFTIKYKLKQNRIPFSSKKNSQHDHISFDLTGNRNIFL